MIFIQELIFECLTPLDNMHSLFINGIDTIHSMLAPLMALIMVNDETSLLQITKLVGLHCIKLSFHLTFTQVVSNNLTIINEITVAFNQKQNLQKNNSLKGANYFCMNSCLVFLALWLKRHVK